MDILLSVDPPQSGIQNMATDEALLDLCRELGQPILRFYQWSEPTLSLGYFQNYEERKSHQPSSKIIAVRRRTGGGAIVHDRELTYSLATPPKHTFSTKQRLFLYETVHQALIKVLQNRGINVRFVSELRQKPKYDNKEFLCFKRFADGDVVVCSKDQGPVKIVGSAQYRDRFGGILQHGSILLDRSDATPELDGLKQIDKSFDNGNIIKWIENICRVFENTLSWRFNRLADTVNSAQNEGFHKTIAFYREKRYVKNRWLLKK